MCVFYITIASYVTMKKWNDLMEYLLDSCFGKKDDTLLFFLEYLGSHSNGSCIQFFYFLNVSKSFMVFVFFHLILSRNYLHGT